jgi:hypothetical protein
VEECKETRIHGRLGWKAMPFAREDFDSNYSVLLDPPTLVSSFFDIPWSTYLGSTFCAGSFGSVPTMELGVGGLHGCKKVFNTGKGPWMFWTLVIPNGVAEQESKLVGACFRRVFLCRWDAQRGSNTSQSTTA